MFTAIGNIIAGFSVSALAAMMMTITGLPVGSVIIPGNLMFDSSSNTNTEYVGMQQTVKHTAAGYDFQTNGSETGATILADGKSGEVLRNVVCTGSGGTNGVGGYYNLCNVKFYSTGSLIWSKLVCKTPQASITSVSGGLLKTWTAGTSKTLGSQIFAGVQQGQFASNRTVGTGGLTNTILGGTGGKLVFANENFVIQTSKVTTVSPGCVYTYEFAPQY